MPPIPPLTRNLMLACTAFFCLQVFLPLDRWLALWPIGSGLFMPWQVVSYAFLHGGVFHLFFNMLGLWMFGSELERIWGQQRYWQFLLAGVLAAAAAQLLVTALTGSMAPTVGASGGLFALLLAFGMTVVIAAVSSFTAARKVLSVDPFEIFRGSRQRQIVG